MKLMFVADIHGSAYYCRKIQEIYKTEKADRLILLGDLLYHGPRNDLPKEYNPKEVINILNSIQDEILCIRGNCDAQVDQMVLEFPILSDYITMFLEDRLVFITHGHEYNENNMPKIKSGDILIHGHTHIPVIKKINNCIYINPGSISLPKENSRNSYMIYENGLFIVKDIDGSRIFDYCLISD